MDKIKEWYEEMKSEYFKHVSQDILDLITENTKKGIGFDETNLPKRMNSYERKLFFPHYTNEYLSKEIDYYLLEGGNEFWKVSEIELTSTYNETLKRNLLHLLLDRFKELIKKTEITNSDDKRKKELLNCELGIYRIHWKSGCSSVAAIGNLHDGMRWIAPTNWTNEINPTGRMDKIYHEIDKLELLLIE